MAHPSVNGHFRDNLSNDTISQMKHPAEKVQHRKIPRAPNSLNASNKTSSSGSSSSNNSRFIQLTTLLFFVAIVDVAFVWRYMDASIGDLFDNKEDSTASSSTATKKGAEIGLHHLHPNQRRKQWNQHAQQPQSEVFQHASSEGGSGLFDPSSFPNVDPRIAKILNLAKVKIDDVIAAQLPTWDDVVSQYGSSPIIYGLETCEPFRQAVKPEDRMTGPAGIFNTGTNLFFQLMKSNCDIKEARKYHREPLRNGVRWQAPWGKHNPPETHRFINVAKMWGEGINQTEFFPVVTIKDPYHWMGSQCRHKYFTFWDHDDDRCPNLVRRDIPSKDVPVVTRVRYALQLVKYSSLLHVWNEWYEEYERQTFPRLHIRFEDLLFHGEEVIKVACDCVGGQYTTKDFVYIEGSAKENGLPIHNGAYGLVEALVQYGNSKNRLKGFTDRDRLYASKELSEDLMTKYGYNPPPLPSK